MSLIRLKAQIESLRQSGASNSPIFRKWQEDVEAALEETFGLNTRQLNQFRSLDFIGPIFLRDPEINYFQEALLQADTMLEIFEKEVEEGNTWSVFWSDIHPDIESTSRERYYRKGYADSVEAALKQLNSRVKDIVKNKTGEEFDGANLMNRAFSGDDPIIKLEPLETESEKSIQKGYQLIFAGVMTGIRNPKAHANLFIDSKRARHMIYLSSLLAYILDEEFIPLEEIS